MSSIHSDLSLRLYRQTSQVLPPNFTRHQLRCCTAPNLACTEKGLQRRASSPPQFVYLLIRGPSLSLTSPQDPVHTKEERTSLGLNLTRATNVANRNACHISWRNTINAWWTLGHRCTTRVCPQTTNGCASDRIGRTTYVLLVVGVIVRCVLTVLVRSIRVQNRCCIRRRRIRAAVRRGRLMLQEQQ